jgi:hypothetical protein
LKLTGRISNSPKTPKFKKLATPHSKKRRLEALAVPLASSSPGDNQPPNPPAEFRFKTKSGKVSISV